MLPLHDLCCQAVLQGDVLDAPDQEVIVFEGVLQVGPLQLGAAVLRLWCRWEGGCWRAAGGLQGHGREAAWYVGGLCLQQTRCFRNAFFVSWTD